MTLFTQELPSLLGGVSREPSAHSATHQVREMNNCWPLIEYGTQRRPPTNHVAELINAEATSPTVAQITGAFFHSINRDVNERYEVIITSSGDIHVYDEDGSSQTVYLPEDSTYLIQANPYQNFRAVTIADYTFIVNRNIAVASDGTSTTAKSYEALVFVRNTDFDTEFTVTLGGTDCTVVTPTGEDPEQREAIDTVALATTLIAQIGVVTSGYTITQFGPVIHIRKTDNSDFTLSTRDGLSNTGLLAIKDKVDDESLLPRVANDGFVVEVVGNADTEWDNYFKRYEARGTSNIYDGVWVEAPAPGEEKAFDRVTMPHVLVRGGILLDELIALPHPTVDYTFVAVAGTPTTDGWSSLADKTSTIEDSDLALVIKASNTKPFAADGEEFDFSASQSIAASQIGYSNLEDADGYLGAYTITFDAAQSTLAFNDLFYVLEQSSDDGVTWTESTAGKISRYLPDQSSYQITHDATLGSSHDFRIRFAQYRWPAMPKGVRDDADITVTLHGEKHAGTGGVQWSIAGEDRRLNLLSSDSSAQIFPSAGKLTLELTNFAAEPQESTNITLSSDEVSSDAAKLLAAAISSWSSANITVTDNGDGTIDLDDVGGAPTIDTWELDATSAAYLITSDLKVGTRDVSARTVRNLTDGSSAVIASHGTETLKITGSLAGGGDNTFQTGDRCVVVGAGTAFFTFRPATWTERAVGTLQDGKKLNQDGTIKRGTNPWPSFFGKTINDIFYYKGRLGVLSEEACVMTQAQDLFNWFRTSVQTYVDSDPIDIETATPDVAVFQHATHWNKKLWVWSEQAQFTLEGEPLLGPKTAYLKPQTRYECSWRVRPWVAGDRQYFCNYRTGHTHIMEMVQEQYTDKYKAESVSKHVPGYIEGNPIQIVGSQQYGFLAVLADTDQKNIYTYNYHFSEGEKVQGAWHKWVFQNTVLGMYMIDQKMGVLMKATDGIFLETMDIDPAESDNGSSDRLTYIDRRMLSSALTVNYNVTVSSETAWILPFDVSTLGTEGTVVAVARGTGEILGSARSAGSSVIASSGDVDATGTDAYVGILYDSCIELLDQHFRDPRTGRLRDDGRLTVRRMGVNYEETLDLDVDINPLNSCNIAISLVGSTIPLLDGEESFGVNQRSSEVTITYQTTAHNPFTVKSGWYEGNFYARGKRI
jgi:hypothetical protein